MAAGLGFKDFTTGEVLTAADVDGYLMQGVWVFASAAARDAAVTSPQEGNFAYLKDTNVTTYYTGSAWANLDTTGMTNPMTTTGDTIYSSSGSTPARLGIGTAGQVLKVNSGATAPEWAVDPTTDVVTTAGDLIYGTGADAVTRLGIGTAGQVLKVNSGATAPEWATPGGGVTSASSNVDTLQATSSTSYTDLNTVQSVTLTTGTKAVVFLSCELQVAAQTTIYASVRISGATTLAASDAYGINFRTTVANVPWRVGAHRFFSGLTAGSNTFTMEFKSSGGNSANFGNRTITVIDLGS